MRIAAANNHLYLEDPEEARMGLLRDAGYFKYDRRSRLWSGPLSLEAMDALADAIRPAALPPALEGMRQELKAAARWVEGERVADSPSQVYAYPVKGQMYSHQLRAANMALVSMGIIQTPGRPAYKRMGSKREGFGLLFEMGCGKTLTAVAIMGGANAEGKARRALVVAPTSVCSVWPLEMERYADFPHTCTPILGDKAKRIKLIRALKNVPDGGLAVAVINYESVWREGILDELIRWHPDVVIADESQRIKDHGAKQSKAMHTLGDIAAYKLILSGTPVQNAAIDLYSQYRFLDSTVFGDSFFAFRGRYCVMGGYQKHQIIKYKHTDELVRKEYSIAYRVTKEEALDLPEQTFLTRPVCLEGKALEAYARLKREGYAQLEGQEVTAATVLTKLLRLQQLSGGFLAPDDGGEPALVSKAKLDALDDILADYVQAEGRKLVIFCRFRAELDAVAERLDKKALRYVRLDGSVPQKERGELVAAFQGEADVMVFLAQIDTAGLGITLTAASACVYYSKTFNYGTYSQSLSRIHRLGQKYPCTYIDIVCRGTVDEHITEALANKEDLARTVVDDWKKYFI